MEALLRTEPDKRRRSLAATAMRGMADLIENAEALPHSARDVSKPAGISVLAGRDFSFQVGNYLAEISVTEDIFSAQDAQGGDDGDSVADDIFRNGHMMLSFVLNVEPVS